MCINYTEKMKIPRIEIPYNVIRLRDTVDVIIIDGL